MALMRFVLAGAGLALLAPQEPAAPTLAIEHEPVDCVLAGQPPLLSACFSPPEEIVRARAYYRLGAGAWQFAPLVPEGSCFAAVLPRPTRTDGTLRYYLEAVDLASQSTRSSEYRALVVRDANACTGLVAAVRPGATQAASVGGRKTLPFVLIGAGAAGAGIALAAGGGGGSASTAAPTLTTSLPATVATTPTTSSTTPASSSTTRPGASTTTTTTLPESTTSTTASTTTTLPQSTSTTQQCSYSIAPPLSPPFPIGGGSGVFMLMTTAACSWNLQSTAGWVTPDVTSGTGSRNVGYSVALNLVGDREATISVTQSPSAAIVVRQKGALLNGDAPTSRPSVTSALGIAGGSGQIVWTVHP